MSPTGDQITLILSWFTIFAQIGIIIAAIILILITLKHPAQILHHLSQKAAEHAMLAGFLISVIGLATSIVYSNIIGFDPCELCWWQRVFLYPQVILFGVALYNEKVRKVEDEMVFLYSLILSVCGATIALFQYYGQMFDPDILSMCTSQGASCAKVFFITFGYITIPMMSLTAYIILILFYFFHRHVRRSKGK